MRFLPPDDNIELYQTGFEQDLFGRKKVSDRLSNIIDRIEDPLVIALDGQWGSGKTFFLRRWVGAHRLENNGKAKTIYFDAFAHDYLGDPLIALVSALNGRIPPVDKSKMDRVKKVAVTLIKPVTRIGLSMATFGATQILEDAGDAFTKAVSSEADKTLANFWKKEEGRQAAFAEFRSALEKLTLSDDGKTVSPLVIVVDELDRCRPDYALEVLEIIKHFFSVPYVHFILGVNLFALENSVKLRYGSNIDATGYLQKFISFTINLPNHMGDYNRTPTVIKHVSNLGKTFGTPRHLTAEIEKQIKYISRNKHISLRDAGKIISSVSLIADGGLHAGIPAGYKIVMVTLLIARVVEPKLYQKLINSDVDETVLHDFFAIQDKHLKNVSNENRKSDYNHDLFLINAIWNTITDRMTLQDKELEDKIGRLFSNFCDREEAKRAPMFIHDNWLNDFKFET